MRIPILAAAIALAPAVASAQDACKAPQPSPAAAPGVHVGGPARGQRLAAMPDADLILAVRRRADGCDYLDVLRSEVSTPSPLNARRTWKLAPDAARSPARQ